LPNKWIFLIPWLFFFSSLYCQSIEDLESRLQDDPANDAILLDLFDHYIKTQQNEKALDMYNRALSVKSNLYYLLTLAELCKKLGRMDERNNYLEAAASKYDLSKTNLRYELAENYLGKKQWARIWNLYSDKEKFNNQYFIIVTMGYAFMVFVLISGICLLMGFRKFESAIALPDVTWNIKSPYFIIMAVLGLTLFFGFMDRLIMPLKGVNDANFVLHGYGLIFPFVVAIGLLLTHHFNGIHWKVLGFAKISLKTALWCVIVGILTFFAVQSTQFVIVKAFASVFNVKSVGFGEKAIIDSLRNIVIAGAIFIVLVPLGEEMIYRGLLYNVFKARAGVNWAIFMSAGVFAVNHIYLEKVVPIFILGVVTAYCYEKYKTIYAPMIVHAIMNFVGLVWARFI